MLLLRQLNPALARQTVRLYANKTASSIMNCNKGPKQVHQETLRHIDPCARINIKSDIFLKVRSTDVHEYPNADVLICELHGGHVKNCPATMQVQVSEDAKLVNVQLAKLSADIDVAAVNNFHCELHVPIRANVHVVSGQDVSVTNIYSDAVHVSTQGNIRTKDIRAESIKLSSSNGNIKCAGLLLGQNTVVATDNSGNVELDKLQGAKFSCRTIGGGISTKSCYSEASKFETDCGKLNLKNVHKESEIYVHKNAELNMTGVHGNIKVHTNGGSMHLQLSEIIGESVIAAENIEESIINISDKIEENSYIEINSTNIALDSALSHLSDCLSTDNKCFQMSRAHDNNNKLIISTKGGSVKLGKLSWADTMRAEVERTA